MYVSYETRQDGGLDMELHWQSENDKASICMVGKSCETNRQMFRVSYDNVKDDKSETNLEVIWDKHSHSQEKFE